MLNLKTQKLFTSYLKMMFNFYQKSLNSGQGKLPLIENHEILNDDLTNCQKRLARLSKQFSKDESYLQHCQATT